MKLLTNTEDQEHADRMVGKATEPASSLEPYLHLTSVSPDLGSDPEMKESKG